MSDTPSTPPEPTPAPGVPPIVAPTTEVPTTAALPVTGAVPPPDALPDAAPTAPAPADKASWKAWAAAGAVAVVVVVGGIVLTQHHGSSSTPVQSAATQTGPGGGGGFASRGAQGTVASIDGSRLTVTSTQPDGTTTTVTVTTTGKTTYSDVVTGTVGDLKAGQTVVVRGAVTNGSVAATNVIEGATGGRGLGGGAGRRAAGATDQGPPPGATPPSGPAGQVPGQGGGLAGGGFTAGTIVSTNGSSFTIKTLDGSQVVVDTTSATMINVTKAITFNDLKKGDTVLAIGTRTGDSVAATSIRRGGLGGFGGFRQRNGTTTTDATNATTPS